MLPKLQLPPVKVPDAIKSKWESFKKLSPKRKATLVTLLACLVVAAGFLFMAWQHGDGFSKLIIDPAYAKDNFEIIATKSDSIGVEGDTAFSIKSKSKVDARLLEKNISLVPQADFDFKKLDDNNFSLTPKSALSGKQVYKVQITSAYVDAAGKKNERDYSWAFQVKDQFKVYQTLPGNETNSVPLDTGIEITFSQDNFSDYENAFRIEPKVEGKFEKHGRTLAFVPQGLTAGTLYTVTVSKDLKLDGSDNRLEKDYVFKFETNPEGAVRGSTDAFNFEKEFNEFSATRLPVFGVYDYNIQTGELPVEVYAFKSEEQFVGAITDRGKVPYWARYSRDTFLQDVSALSKVASFKLPISRYSSQEFIQLPNTLPKGYYLVQVQADSYVRQAYFQVTDLAVFTSVTQTDTLVWVNDTNTKSAVAGAKVEKIGGEGSVTTGNNGVATFSTDTLLGSGLDDYQETYLKVSAGSSSEIVPLDLYYGRETSADNDYWYYFYADKSMYKPDDTINFWGFVKSRDGKEAGKEMTVRLSKSDYTNYYYEPVVVSETKANISSDAISGKMDVKNLTPGGYYLEFLLGDKTVSTQYIDVEDYTKPAYEISLSPEKYAIYAGDNIVVNAMAKFFEGTPVADLGLTYFYDQSGNKEMKTDGLGLAQIVIPTTYADCTGEDDCHYPGSTYISVSPTGAEAGDITGDTQVRVFGAKVKGSLAFKQQADNRLKITTTVNKVDLDKVNSGNDDNYGDYLGAVASGISFRAEITEVTYERYESGTYYDFINKVVQKEYDYRKDEKPFGKYEGVTDDKGEFAYELNINPDKEYKVKIIVNDGAGRVDTNTNYYSARSDSYGRSKYYMLDYKDPESTGVFPVGQRVELDFETNGGVIPSNGKKSFLYYQLQKGLLSYELSEQGSYGFIFEEKDIPNMYVKGVWFDGETYHASYEKSISFDRSSRKLNISIKSDKDKYKPGEQVSLQTQVTDEKGQPVQANLNLNLIDEAFYQLNEESVDTLSGLYNVSINSGELASYASNELPVGGTGGAEQGGCFLAGTKIKMADGSYKNIEAVKAGDEIMTFENEYARKLVPTQVAQAFQHRVGVYLIINGTLKVTPEHRIFINHGWETIGAAKVGDVLIDEKGARVAIRSIERVQATVDVYNLRIEKYSTYIADGIYVHNDKGGGRENFVDNALFASVQTDAQGKAETKFKLPDNLTSWRVTAQGINSQLFAGSNATKVVVTLPVFATETFASEYLTSDKPVIKINSFGEALKSGNAVEYSLSAGSLGLGDWKSSGKAFEPQYVELPQLSEGTHKITAGVKFEGQEDRLTQSIRVIGSRSQEKKQNFYELKSDLAIAGSATGRTDVVFSDKNQGQFYDYLSLEGWVDGDRVDQRLAAVLSSALKQKYFGQENISPESFDGKIYQFPDGSIGLLPYGEGGLELSAKIASVAADYFDRDSLANYFYTVYSDKASSREQLGLALFGLSSLGEPVLIPAQHYAAIGDLTVREKLFAALTLYKIGDAESSRRIYLGVMNDYAEHLDPYIRLKVSDNQDEVLADTALAAILAGGLNDDYRDNLWQYTSENYSKTILTKMEKLMYISETLPKLKAGDASFTLQLGGKKTNVNLSQGSVYKISLTPEEFKSMSFSNLKGSIGVNSSYDVPSMQQQTSSYVSVKREYSIAGNKTSAFKENDLVEVTLTPDITKEAPGEDYQLVDLLPSGLKIVTNPYSRYHAAYDRCTRYPFEIDGQKIKFYLQKGWLYSPECQNTFRYYARVVSLGQYTAEPALIESMRSSEVKNFSSADKITIAKQ